MHEDNNRKLENFWQQKIILENRKPRAKIKTHEISFVSLLTSKILRTKPFVRKKIHACNSRRPAAFLQHVHLYFSFTTQKTETTGLVRCKSRHVSFLKNIYVMTQHSLAFFKPSSAPCLIKRVNYIHSAYH